MFVKKKSAGASVVAVLTLFLAGAQAADPGLPVIDLGNRRELFVDDYLVAEMKGVQLLVHAPQPEEIAVVCDAPWEGNGCGYFTVLHDKPHAVYRMYYHAWQIPVGRDPGHPLVIGYFESRDGIAWTRPELGVCEYDGSKANNILLDRMGDGSMCHDFSPFLDENPRADPAAKYKAVGAGMETSQGVWAYASPDGIHWAPLASEPVFRQGAFDTQNIAFWSVAEQKYLLYYRTFRPDGTREVQRAVSDDFLHWTADLPPRLAPVFKLLPSWARGDPHSLAAA